MKELLDRNKLTEFERQRFLREAQVQGQLEHPSIVPVYDIDQRPDGSTYVTMLSESQRRDDLVTAGAR